MQQKTLEKQYNIRMMNLTYASSVTLIFVVMNTFPENISIILIVYFNEVYVSSCIIAVAMKTKGFDWVHVKQYSSVHLATV